MSKFSPYTALCNIFRNPEGEEQPEPSDGDSEISEMQVNTKSVAANINPKKISMINNSCQTQPLRDYSIDKVIPNYKQRQRIRPQPSGLKSGAKDDNFQILRPSYAAFTGEKPYVELQSKARLPRRPQVPRTPRTSIPRRTITPPKLAPQMEIAYNPLVNTRGSTKTNQITHHNNPLTNKNPQNVPLPIKPDNNIDTLRHPNVNAVYRTISTLKEAINNSKLCVDSDSCNNKCICQDCGTLAVLSESLKHPVSFEIPLPYDEACPQEQQSNTKKHRSQTRIIAKAYTILEQKLELMEQRLQELEILCQHYEKINTNHSGLTFDIYTQCTHEGDANYENSEASIKDSPKYEVNFETSEVNIKGCHFPLFSFSRNIADKFKRQKLAKPQPPHLDEQSVYTCSTVDQDFNQTNDKLEEKPTLRSLEYLRGNKKPTDTKIYSSKLSTESEVNPLGEKLDNFDFNLFTEQEVRDLLIYIRERNTNKKVRFQPRKQNSTEVLFRNKIKQPIIESTPNFIIEENTGHLEHFDETSGTTFQDFATDSFQEPSRQSIFLDSRIGDQQDPFDYVRFLNTKIQEKIYNENTNISAKKSYTPGMNVLHNRKHFFRKHETLKLDQNNPINLFQELNTNNFKLHGTKVKLNSPNSNRVNLLHPNNLQLNGTKINLQPQSKKPSKKESIDIDSMMHKLNEEISFLFNKFHNTHSSKNTKINTVYTNKNLNSNTVSNASTFFSEFEIPEKLSSCNPVTSKTSFETENETFNLTKTVRGSTDFTHNLSSEEPKSVYKVPQNVHFQDSEERKLISETSATGSNEILTHKKNLMQNSNKITLNHNKQKISHAKCFQPTNHDILPKKVAKPYVSKIPKAIAPKIIIKKVNVPTKNEEDLSSNCITTSKSLNTSENTCKVSDKPKFQPTLNTNKTFSKNLENSVKPQVKTEEQFNSNSTDESKKKFDLYPKFTQKPKPPVSRIVKPLRQKKNLNQNKTLKLEKPSKVELKKEPQETKQKFVKKMKMTLSKNYISSKTSVRNFFRRAKTSKMFLKSKIPIRSFNRPVQKNTTLEEKEKKDNVVSKKMSLGNEIDISISEEPTVMEIVTKNDLENNLLEMANVEHIMNINCVVFTIDTMLLNTIFPFEDTSEDEPIFTEVFREKNVDPVQLEPKKNMSKTMVVCNKRIPTRHNVTLTVQTLILSSIEPRVEKDEVCLFSNLQSAMNILLYRRSTHSDLSSTDAETTTADLRPVNQPYNTGNFVILNMNRQRFPAYDGIPADIRRSIQSRNDVVYPYPTSGCDVNCSGRQYSFENLSEESNSSYEKPPSLVKRLKNMFANTFRKTDNKKKHCHDRFCPVIPEETYYVQTEHPQGFQRYKKPCKKSVFRSVKDYVDAKVFNRPKYTRACHNKQPPSFTVVPLIRTSRENNSCCTCCSCETIQTPKIPSKFLQTRDDYPEDRYLEDDYIPEVSKKSVPMNDYPEYRNFRDYFKPKIPKRKIPMNDYPEDRYFKNYFKLKIPKRFRPMNDYPEDRDLDGYCKPKIPEKCMPMDDYPEDRDFEDNFKLPMNDYPEDRDLEDNFKHPMNDYPEDRDLEDNFKLPMNDYPEDRDLEDNFKPTIPRKSLSMNDYPENPMNNYPDDRDFKPEVPLQRRISIEVKEPAKEVRRPSKQFNYCCLTRHELGMDDTNIPTYQIPPAVPTTLTEPAGPSSQASLDLQTKKAASRRTLFTNSRLSQTEPPPSTNLDANSTVLANYRTVPNRRDSRNVGNVQPYYEPEPDSDTPLIPLNPFPRPSQTPESLRNSRRSIVRKPSIRPQQPGINIPRESNSRRNSTHSRRSSHNHYHLTPQTPVEYQPDDDSYNQRPRKSNLILNPNFYNQVPSSNPLEFLPNLPSRNNSKGVFVRQPDHSQHSRGSVYFEPYGNPPNDMQRSKTSNAHQLRRTS